MEGLGIAVVQAVDPADRMPAGTSQQLLHRVVGDIGRGERLCCGAGRFDGREETCGEPLAAACAGREHQPADEALLEEGVFQYGVAHGSGRVLGHEEQAVFAPAPDALAASFVGCRDRVDRGR